MRVDWQPDQVSSLERGASDRLSPGRVIFRAVGAQGRGRLAGGGASSPGLCDVLGTCPTWGQPGDNERAGPGH